jgi:hypothetical protein
MWPTWPGSRDGGPFSDTPRNQRPGTGGSAAAARHQGSDGGERRRGTATGIGVATGQTPEPRARRRFELKSEAPSAGMLDDLAGLPPGTELADWEDPKVLPLVEVRDLFLILGKALRAYQLYDRKNPVYRRFLESLVEAFKVVWATEEALHLVVEESRITWKGEEVYRNDQRSESLAFLLYRDGVREFTPMVGIEETELEDLLDALHRAKHARGDADDLVTLLWDQEFHCLRYEVVDLLGDGVEVPDPGAGVLENPLDILHSEGFSLLDAEEVTPEAAEDRETEGSGAAAPDGTVRVEDFNPTLHALEPEDRAYIAELIQG